MNAIRTGTVIRDARKRKGLTQKQLADSIGVTSYAVSKWENGRGMPDISILPSLSETLDLSISEIVTGKSEPDSEESLNSLIQASVKEIRHKTFQRVCISVLVCILAFTSIIAVLNKTSAPVYYQTNAYTLYENGKARKVPNIRAAYEYGNIFIQYNGPEIRKSWIREISEKNHDISFVICFSSTRLNQLTRNKSTWRQSFTADNSYGKTALNHSSDKLGKIYYCNDEDLIDIEKTPDDADLIRHSILIYDSAHPDSYMY